MSLRNKINFLLTVLTSTILLSCFNDSSSFNSSGAEEQVVIEYWEKWSNFEKEAMLEVIERFHASQDRIRVNYVTVRDNRMKTLLATAGGNPPDVAGLFPEVIPKYAEKEALVPLDQLMERDGLSKDQYLDSISKMLDFEGRTWCLPTTPASLALYYNKRLFRESGLDPDEPPKTLTELDRYARILTIKNEDNRIVRLGFSPEIPTWFRHAYIYWFNGRHWDGDSRMTLNTNEFVNMLAWLQGYPITYGQTPLQRFHAAEGKVVSAQNHFISGRVAMQLQGVWMANFIDQFNKNLEYGVAPFPTNYPDAPPTTFVDCDVLVIPAGAKYKEEAWEFIKFVQQQKNIELLCSNQWKFSPLKKVSKDFYEDHPHPYIELFRDLAESPNAIPAPRTAIIDELKTEMAHAVTSVWLREATPEEAAAEAQDKLQRLLDQHDKQWDRVRDFRIENWNKL